MQEPKLLLVLANSARSGKHCVAGKEVHRLTDGSFAAGSNWVRLSDPRDSEGAVPYRNSVCGSRGTARLLDIIKVPVLGPCNNPDHPEDWFFDPAEKWEFLESLNPSHLAGVADQPSAIWHDGSQTKSVPAGYVRQMAPKAATLYLIKAPPAWTFRYWKELDPNTQKEKYYRRLEFVYAGQHHEFSVTDMSFTSRHKIFDKMKVNEPQALELPRHQGTYFCLSLTRLLAPNFNRKHYKICATIFEA